MQLQAGSRADVAVAVAVAVAAACPSLPASCRLCHLARPLTVPAVVLALLCRKQAAQAQQALADELQSLAERCQQAVVAGEADVIKQLVLQAADPRFNQVGRARGDTLTWAPMLATHVGHSTS